MAAIADDVTGGDEMQQKPVYKLGLDPLHWTNAKLFIRDVLELEENSSIPGTYKLYSHIILRVCIVGYIVSVDKREKVTNFKVDDGTGVIMCSRWKNKPGDEEDSTREELGMLIKVHGRIKKYNNERQLIVDYKRKERNPNAEVLHWMDVIRLNEIYKSEGENLRSITCYS